MDISKKADSWIDKKMKEYNDILDIIRKINDLGYGLPGEFPIDLDAEFVKRYVNNVEVAETDLLTVRRDVVLLYFADKRPSGFTYEDVRKELDSLGVKYTIYIPDLIHRNEIINKKVVGKERKKPCGTVAEYCIAEEGKSNLIIWLDNNKPEHTTLKKLRF